MRFLRLILLFMLFCALVSVGLSAPVQQSNTHRLSKVNTIDTEEFFDVNNIKMWVTNTGSFAWDVTTGNPGLIFPKGTTKTAIFASGLWVGAKVNGQIRVAISEYSDEYVPGSMKDSTFQADEDRFHVYKINRGDTQEGNADYKNWPIQDGAPFEVVDGDTVPKIYGDQTLWAVYNDADASAHTNNSGSTAPLGVEVQVTAFGYNRSGALGNTVFLKFKIINKGPNTLDSTFIALWSDPDLGDAGDDLVGCDTTLSVGFVYNATNDDATYGATPPCVGYDFFQGPIVPAGPSDTAWVSGEPRPGYKNLPMTAFNKYINGTDPTNALDSYNYMKGLNAVEGKGAPYVNPVTGDTTAFAMSGDPVADLGWLDDNPADRRFMMCSGPLTMAPGDTQEVVAAIVVGQGPDRLSSITAMKNYDTQAQAVFDLNFKIPPPPPQPTVWYRAFDRAIDLIWDTQADGDIQYSPELHQEFVMQGYNVYQGASVAGPWTKIATFDYEDDIGYIYMDMFNPEKGAVERSLVQAGTNNGLDHHLWIDKDFVRGGNLLNGHPYYFAVTAYSYDDSNIAPYYLGLTQIGWIAEVLENAFVPVEVVPLASVATLIDTALHTSGLSDGLVEIDYLDQSQITGHTYQVTFHNDTVSGEIFWKLFDVDNNCVVLDSQFNQSGDYSYPRADGMMVRVIEPVGVKSILETQNAAGPVDPPHDVAYSWNSTHEFYVSSDLGDDFSRMNYRGLIGIDDWEFRFTAAGSQYYDWNTEELWPDSCPFEVWNLGAKTLDDTTDDKRVQITILDDDLSADPVTRRGAFSAGDRIYVCEREYYEPLPQFMVYDWPDDFKIGRIKFNNEVPAPGTRVRFITFRRNNSADVFTFKTYKSGQRDGTVVANNLDKVRAVPNPYFNASLYEIDQFHRVIKFINLPSNRCTIRIFNLAGDLVRVLTKDDPTSSILEWDVKTTNNLPVASGIYIYYIEAEGLGSKTGKMAIFTEKERLITY
jgi:hypothetical protein